MKGIKGVIKRLETRCIVDVPTTHNTEYYNFMIDVFTLVTYVKRLEDKRKRK